MKLKLASYLFLAVSINSFGDTEDAVGITLDKLFNDASHVMTAKIGMGQIVGQDVVCGMVYRADLVQVFSGSVDQKQLSFISWKPLSVGDTYVLFLDKVDPYAVPKGLKLEDPQKRAQLTNCARLVEGIVPEFSAGWGSKSLKVVRSTIDPSAEWLEFDALHISLPKGLDSKEENTEICIEESLDDISCTVVKKRLLIRLDDFSSYFQECER